MIYSLPDIHSNQYNHIFLYSKEDIQLNLHSIKITDLKHIKYNCLYVFYSIYSVSQLFYKTVELIQTIYDNNSNVYFLKEPSFTKSNLPFFKQLANTQLQTYKKNSLKHIANRKLVKKSSYIKSNNKVLFSDFKRLYKNGLSCRSISKRLGITLLTVLRWKNYCLLNNIDLTLIDEKYRTI